MIEKMMDLLRGNDMCVLATCSENTPHCSLMAYVTDEEGTGIYMATLRNSRKYRNIARNPRVSLLVDTRSESPAARGKVKAMTVSGVSSFVEDVEAKQNILREIAARHPHLNDLILNPDVEALQVKAESFLLLDGAIDSHFATVP